MRYLILFIALFMAACCGFAVGDDLFGKFVDPDAEARPFVRWWWGENSVTEENILREIEVMDKAGISKSHRPGKDPS